LRGFEPAVDLLNQRHAGRPPLKIPERETQLALTLFRSAQQPGDTLGGQVHWSGLPFWMNCRVDLSARVGRATQYLMV